MLGLFQEFPKRGDFRTKYERKTRTFHETLVI